LSGGIGLFRARLDMRAMRWINRASGAIITLFGVLALASLVGA
jgi:threonine/homoserine/homoserine lactone efflux protein